MKTFTNYFAPDDKPSKKTSKTPTKSSKGQEMSSRPASDDDDDADGRRSDRSHIIVRELEGELDALRLENQVLRGVVDDYESNKEAGNNTAVNKLTKEKKNLQEMVDTLNESFRGQHEEITNLKARLQSATSAGSPGGKTSDKGAAQLKERIAQLEQQNQILETENSKLKSQLAEAQKREKKLQTELQENIKRNLLGKNDNAFFDDDDEDDEPRPSLQDKKTIEEMTHQLSVKEKKIDELQKQIEDVKSQCTKSQDPTETEKEKKSKGWFGSSKKKTIKKTEDAETPRESPNVLETLKNKITEMQMENNAITTEKNLLKKDLDEKQSKLCDLQLQLKSAQKTDKHSHRIQGSINIGQTFNVPIPQDGGSDVDKLKLMVHVQEVALQKVCVEKGSLEALVDSYKRGQDADKQKIEKVDYRGRIDTMTNRVREILESKTKLEQDTKVLQVRLEGLETDNAKLRNSNGILINQTEISRQKMKQKIDTYVKMLTQAMEENEKYTLLIANLRESYRKDMQIYQGEVRTLRAGRVRKMDGDVPTAPAFPTFNQVQSYLPIDSVRQSSEPVRTARDSDPPFSRLNLEHKTGVHDLEHPPSRIFYDCQASKGSLERQTTPINLDVFNHGTARENDSTDSVKMTKMHLNFEPHKTVEHNFNWDVPSLSSVANADLPTPKSNVEYSMPTSMHIPNVDVKIPWRYDACPPEPKYDMRKPKKARDAKRNDENTHSHREQRTPADGHSPEFRLHNDLVYKWNVNHGYSMLSPSAAQQFRQQPEGVAKPVIRPAVTVAP